MLEVIIDTLLDTLKAIPFLFAIYFILEAIQSKAGKININAKSMDKIGPIVGAVAGCIPQCGLSAAATAVYSDKLIKGGTLIAVFLATSDEAIPVLLSSLNNWESIFSLLFYKLIIGITFGYILNFTLFSKDELSLKKQISVELDSCEKTEHHSNKGEFLKHAVFHTTKISIIILSTLLIVNFIIYFAGDDNVSNFLLSFKGAQPLITAAFGLIPGCGISVILTKLFTEGQITFGSAMAGLSTGAGFGYILLFKSNSLKKSMNILFATYVCGALSGIIINLMG